MYAVTFEASDLPLVPSIFGAEITFNGDIDLDGLPDGSWNVVDVYVQTATPPLTGLMPILGKARLPKDSPLFPVVVEAAKAYDRQTKAITDLVVDELRHADDDAQGRPRCRRPSRRDGVGVMAPLSPAEALRALLPALAAERDARLAHGASSTQHLAAIDTLTLARLRAEDALRCADLQVQAKLGEAA